MEMDIGTGHRQIAPTKTKRRHNPPAFLFSPQIKRQHYPLATTLTTQIFEITLHKIRNKT